MNEKPSCLLNGHGFNPDGICIYCHQDDGTQTTATNETPTNTDSTLRPPDEFKGKTFRECAEIIVGNPKDEDWTDHQINQLCKQHEQLIALKVQEARIDELEQLQLLHTRNYRQTVTGNNGDVYTDDTHTYISKYELQERLAALHKIKGKK